MFLRPVVFQTTRRPDSAKDSPSFTMHPCHHPPVRRLLTSFARARMLFNLTCLRYTTFLDAIACASNTRALISSASLGQWCLNCLHLSEMTAISGVSGIICGIERDFCEWWSYIARAFGLGELISKTGTWIDYSPQRESTDQVIDTQDLGSVDS